MWQAQKEVVWMIEITLLSIQTEEVLPTQLTTHRHQTHTRLQTYKCQVQADAAHVGADDRMHSCHTEVFSLLPTLQSETETNQIQCKQRYKDVNLGRDFQDAWGALRLGLKCRGLDQL